MTKQWICYETDQTKAEKIAKKFKIEPLLAEIISNKDFESEEEIRVFLNPTRTDFENPFLFQDMEIAVDRILQAMEKKEKIVIYGDYDVDGITSTTVLKQFLEERGVEVETYIPNRLDEGYGLNREAIKQIADEGNHLMITVDCGISGAAEVEYAKELGIEVIITDHHEAPEVLPKAVAIIDAKRKDNTYPFRGLAGVGVVFKFIQAISMKLNLEEKAYLKYLDIVCVGTISDIVPLVGENRVIAKLGLKLIQVTKNLGLRELVKSTGYQKIDSNTVSFGIAPRINACGRMGHQEEALRLFLTTNPQEAVEITQKLNEYNRIRQETERQIFEEALNQIAQNQLEKENSIIIGAENWHHGVIGIVSSKITEMYFKPSILICFEGEEGKGSGRSVPGFDLHDALCQCGDLLEKYGGHEMAVGLTVKKDKFKQFHDKFEKIAEEQHVKEIVPILYVDGKLSLRDMNKETVRQLALLEPFGEANKMPIFLYRNLKIDSIRALSEGKHLKLTLKDVNDRINAIGFNLGKLAEEYQIGDKIDVAGTLELNSFNGNETIQINIKDIRKAY